MPLQFNLGTYVEGGDDKKCVCIHSYMYMDAFSNRVHIIIYVHVYTCTYNVYSLLRHTCTCTCVYILGNKLHGINTLCDSAAQPVSVGWGSKSTQFHGSRGKQSAKESPVTEVSPALPWDDLQPRISWRGDGEFFVCSCVEPSTGKEGCCCEADNPHIYSYELID